MVHGIYEILTFGKHYDRTISIDPVDNGTAVISTVNHSSDGSIFDRWSGPLVSTKEFRVLGYQPKGKSK